MFHLRARRCHRRISGGRAHGHRRAHGTFRHHADICGKRRLQPQHEQQSPEQQPACQACATNVTQAPTPRAQSGDRQVRHGADRTTGGRAACSYLWFVRMREWLHRHQYGMEASGNVWDRVPLTQPTRQQTHQMRTPLRLITACCTYRAMQNADCITPNLATLR